MKEQKNTMEDIYLALNINKIKKLSIENNMYKIEKELLGLSKKEKSLKQKIIISTILRNITYSTLICIILIAYISHIIYNLIPIITLKSIYIPVIFIGVLTISFLGAFLSSKIENKVRKKQKNTLSEIQSKIDTNVEKLKTNKEEIKKTEKEIQKIYQKLNIEICNNYTQFIENIPKNTFSNYLTESNTIERRNRTYRRIRIKDNYP